MRIRLVTSAKINIGLYVYGVRDDGYHDLESLFYPVNNTNSNLFGDVLEVEEGCFCGAGKFRLLQSGITIGGSVDDNICAKAYRLLDERFGLPPVETYLEKNVPIGAGLGGGSADGVYMLKALDQLFALHLSDSQMFEFASALGSDCPFFLHEKPMFVEGRGDILTPVKEIKALKNIRIEIVPSDVFISTGHAYSIVGERKRNSSDSAGKSLLQLLDAPIESWQGAVVNDFEEPVFSEFPQLREIKESLLAKGAKYSSMTGSGSAVYGLFSE